MTRAGTITGGEESAVVSLCMGVAWAKQVAIVVPGRTILVALIVKPRLLSGQLLGRVAVGAVRHNFNSPNCNCSIVEQCFELQVHGVGSSRYSNRSMWSR